MTVTCPHCKKESFGMAYCDYCGMAIKSPSVQAIKSTPVQATQQVVLPNTPITPSQAAPQPVVNIAYQQPHNNGGLRCYKCGSNNISVQFVQTSAKSSHNARGCLWELMRLSLIFCTCGLWLLIGRSKGKSKTKFKNQKMCVCQNCGASWKA